MPRLVNLYRFGRNLWPAFALVVIWPALPFYPAGDDDTARFLCFIAFDSCFSAIESHFGLVFSTASLQSFFLQPHISGLSRVMPVLFKCRYVRNSLITAWSFQCRLQAGQRLQQQNLRPIAVSAATVAAAEYRHNWRHRSCSSQRHCDSFYRCHGSTCTSGFLPSNCI